MKIDDFTVEPEGLLRYLVSSPGREPWLVDLLIGECGCPDFQVRVKAKKLKKECKHIRPAKVAFADFYLAEIRKETRKHPSHD